MAYKIAYIMLCAGICGLAGFASRPEYAVTGMAAGSVMALLVLIWGAIRDNINTR